VEAAGPLVSTAWLAERLDDTGLVLAHVGWVHGEPGAARREYEQRHIRGAVFLDVDEDLAARAFVEGPGRHPLPTPYAFAETMGAAGVGDDDLVVAYDAAAGSLAARLWWMLDATGHRAAVLDGGLAAWDGPVETGPSPRRAPARFTARPWPPDRVLDADRVAEALATGSAVVLDARAGERYRGETEPIDEVAGHIPGAVGAPYADNLGPDGRFRSPEELRDRYSRLGVRDAEGAIVYCGSGVTSAHDLLAMRLAGLGDGWLYAGSWSDWSSDPERPVATGADP
jgi:thiosulfate/3-mercaptopyruvate sulfurtransferase